MTAAMTRLVGPRHRGSNAKKYNRLVWSATVEATRDFDINEVVVSVEKALEGTRRLNVVSRRVTRFYGRLEAFFLFCGGNTFLSNSPGMLLFPAGR